MQLDQRSVTAGYRVAKVEMTAELEAFKQRAALDYFELRRELDAALEQVRMTQLEFLNFKASVTHDRQTAERDPPRAHARHRPAHRARPAAAAAVTGGHRNMGQRQSGE